MDAAIAKAVTKVRQEASEAAEAREIVRPWVGNLPVALDSGAAVYKAALDTLGVKTEGVHPSAYRAILAAQPKPGTSGHRIAQDAAPAQGFAARFPGLSTL
jgi:hypothetical protein